MWLSSLLSDPSLGLFPFLVEAQKASFSTSLDELIRLCDELGCEHPAWELRVRGDGTCLWVPCDLGNLGRGVDELGGYGGVLVDGRCAFQPVGQEEFGIVFTNS